MIKYILINGQNLAKSKNDFFMHQINLLVYDQLYTNKWVQIWQSKTTFPPDKFISI